MVNVLIQSVLHKKKEEIQVAIQTCFKKLVLETSRLVTNELLGTTTILSLLVFQNTTPKLP